MRKIIIWIPIKENETVDEFVKPFTRESILNIKLRSCQICYIFYILVTENFGTTTPWCTLK